MNTQNNRLISFFILLLSSLTCNTTWACYFYPGSSDVEISFFSPTAFSDKEFKYSNFQNFNFYDAHAFSDNILMWSAYCKHKVDYASIREVLESDEVISFKTTTKNAFIKYLHKVGDAAALSYLQFAKEVELCSPGFEDVWENNPEVTIYNRQRLLKLAQNRVTTTDNVTLKKRYYFQIFRLLQYLGENEKIISLYDEVYSKTYKTGDLLSNWIFYYRLSVEPDQEKQNFLVSKLFGLPTDNRFQFLNFFQKDIAMEKILRLAKTSQERAKVIALYTSVNQEFNLDSIKQIYRICPSSLSLEFLLIREINKLEDWILVPTYTLFMPTSRDDYWENSTNSRILDRVKVDRKRAKELLNFVCAVDLNKVNNPSLWQLTKAYLEFLTKENHKSLETLKQIPLSKVNGDFKSLHLKIYTLATVANLKGKKIELPSDIQQIIMNHETDKNFLFAIAKEIEFLGDNVTAALILSNITSSEFGGVFWKSISGKRTLADDYYSSWYEYVDAELSAEECGAIAKELFTPKKTKFQKWMFNQVKNQKNRVFDLLGIKFMRIDDIANAQKAFQNVDNEHYTNAPMFNKHPFLDGYLGKIGENSNQITSYNKSKALKELLRLKKSVAETKNPNRAKEYFLIANFYFNTSYYGNSWMFNRIYRSVNLDENYLDENNYYGCERAIFYFEKALQHARNKNFAALCELRIATCKLNKATYLFDKQQSLRFGPYYSDTPEVNSAVFFDRLKKRYPSQYFELTSSCEIAARYFKAG
ncbi:hypothetical protein [Flavobacterium aurantiibacter]|nr:hypothetical protein [Flavobacterium aurantiibacter]